MAKKRKLGEYTAERGDCVEKMWLLAKGEAGLVVCDPPYNQGMLYDSITDNLEHNAYLAWTAEWLAAAVHALNRHGSLWIFVPDEWVSELDLMAKRKFGLHKRRQIVWSFTFGQASQKNFSKSHCHVLYYTKAKTKFTFNADAIRVPSARQLVYKDKRQNEAGKLPDATWMLLREQLEPFMTPDTDTWLESRICGTFKERKNHSPNQIPIPLYERIVLATSNRGDLVLDPFAGTGGCGVACLPHGRNYLAYDLSKECIRQIKSRLNAGLKTRFEE